jgi:hypothetical protein
MAWIHFANHKSLAFTFNNTAMFTTLFDRRIYFHDKSSRTIILKASPKSEKAFNVINIDRTINITNRYFSTYL